jgi:hypothetical protein
MKNMVVVMVYSTSHEIIYLSSQYFIKSRNVCKDTITLTEV